MLKGMLIVLGVLVIVTLLLVGCKATRAGYESAKYRVIKSDGQFQVRDYATLVVAETPMDAAGDGMDGGFGKLFQFITGGNLATQKIAMTTPVFVNTDPTNARMAFVMPGKYSLSNLPQPTDKAVALRRIEGGHFAVLRFAGSRSGKNQDQARARLSDLMKKHGYQPTGSSFFAYYDPPWIPGFLRRNEVLFPISSGSGAVGPRQTPGGLGDGSK